MDTIPAPTTLPTLRQTVAHVVGAAPNDIGDDDNLIFLGLGSLEVMRLITAWRRSGVAADFAALVAEPTLAAWWRHLSAANPADR